MVIHSRPSTWIAVVSILLTAFIALPTLHNYMILGIIVLVDILLVFQARREGKQIEKHHEHS